MNPIRTKFGFLFNDDPLPSVKGVINGTFEPYTIRIFDRYLSLENSMLDLGAWAGPCSLYACTRAKEVWSFEPDPVAFASLQGNIQVNKPCSDTIHAFPFCASNKTGEISFGTDPHRRNQAKFGDCCSQISRKDSRECIIVKSYRIEDFIHDFSVTNLGFVKMDIESGEEFVIPDMESIMKTINPTIYLSFHARYFRNENSVKCMENILRTYYSHVYNSDAQEIFSVQNAVRENYLISLVFTNEKW